MKTEKQKIAQWDLVDNAIFDLIKTLNPSATELKWDIRLITEIRLTLQNYFAHDLKLCAEKDFYP